MEGLHIQPRVVHITNNHELFMAFITLNSSLGIVHIIYSLELFIEFKVLSSQPVVVHAIHNP